MDSLPPTSAYPGETSTAEDLFRFADEYQRAAEALLEIRRPGEPLSRAPFHLVAIHAIELYLNALLIFEGMKPAQLRALHHDLHARVSHELAGALLLKKSRIWAICRRAENILSVDMASLKCVRCQISPECTRP